ncbi:MAG: 3-dehydroquinate synthase [Bacteroidetes bacterium]|nr:3-dehydroquinate synthase [Bacteroidota bacterium]
MEKGCIQTSHAADTVRDLLSEIPAGKAIVLTDENTLINCYPVFKGKFDHHVITIPSGEENKNLHGAERIWNELTQLEADRSSILIVLGGGVLGDMGGFCAATYKRGIRFILVPTTLLAQVDASVGGKLGIDFKGFKNHIGVFQNPVATVVDTGFLKTLPSAELRSGFAEVVKHCLLSDNILWNTINRQSLEDQQWEELVSHSIAFKTQITTADPTEKGLRKVLNFGHTIGHALETASFQSGNRILHGEAIAAGMVCESWIALQKGNLTESELQSISHFILKIFGKIGPSTTGQSLVALMRQDKKNKEGKILMALPKGIGKYQWDVEVGSEEILNALDFYAKLQR